MSDTEIDLHLLDSEIESNCCEETKANTAASAEDKNCIVSYIPIDLSIHYVHTEWRGHMKQLRGADNKGAAKSSA